MITQARFLEEVRLVLAEVSRQLVDRRAGKDGSGTVGELEAIEAELSDLEAKAVSGSLPPKGQRYLTAAWIVIDGWPLDHGLGPRICRLEDLYQRKLP